MSGWETWYVRFVGVASPPVQSSNTGLKIRNKKCEIIMHPMSENPIDIRALYFGCLGGRKADSSAWPQVIHRPLGAERSENRGFSSKEDWRWNLASQQSRRFFYHTKHSETAEQCSGPLIRF